ncbi:MAG: hypothetical protein A4E40_01075 [Methanoregulaceae archaeon PtaU1.Bin059]|nr:MAG: hypothetical protein A4E39_00476 [Methanoregulaceae archaeon PtaB.Bin152]OPY39571.1 MAG: hypothetical protein A4E40_01075 [Methanoregulaceae archaeon PtaU1.Bin059]
MEFGITEILTYPIEMEISVGEQEIELSLMPVEEQVTDALRFILDRRALNLMDLDKESFVRAHLENRSRYRVRIDHSGFRIIDTFGKTAASHERSESWTRMRAAGTDDGVQEQ